jgi:hypothetical protein
MATMRAAVVELLGGKLDADAEQIAAAFVAVYAAYNQQLAVRGDVDPAPFTRAVMAILKG